MFKYLLICISIFGLTNSAPAKVECPKFGTSGNAMLIGTALRLGQRVREILLDPETSQLVMDMAKFLFAHRDELMKCNGPPHREVIEEIEKLCHLVNGKLRQVLEIGQDDDIITSISTFQTPTKLTNLINDPEIMEEIRHLFVVYGESAMVCASCYMNILMPYLPRVMEIAKKFQFEPELMKCLLQMF